MNSHEKEEALPDFSVVIPAFNAAPTIERAVRSAWGTGAAAVVVVDDGSADETADIAEALESRVVRQENNGASRARAKGISLVETPLVTLLDADDTLITEGVWRSCAVMRDLNARGISFIGALGGTVASRRRFAHWPEGVTPASLLSRCRAPGPPGAFVWSTAALMRTFESGPKPLHPRYAEDYELLIRATRYGRIATHDKVSCRYTIEGGKSSRDVGEGMDCVETIRAYYSLELGIPIRHRSPAELRTMRQIKSAFASHAAGDITGSLRDIGTALVGNPRVIARLTGRKALRWLLT